MTQNSFPTEFIELPSKGHFYPEDNPLSSGKVEMKYMTAKEEDIITSVNLIQQGVVLDKLLETLVIDKSINLDDILIGDKNALIVGARILAYGKNYEFNYIDSLGEKVKGKIDLTKLKETKVDLSKFEKGQNIFNFTLPKTERQIVFQLTTNNLEKQISTEVDALKKVYKDVEPENSTRLKYQIISVDGNQDRKFINNFVDNEFLSRDSLVFRQYLTKITPDMDMTTTVNDSNGKETEVVIPITVRFFWPATGI